MEHALSFARPRAVPRDYSSLATLQLPLHSRAIISVSSGDLPQLRLGREKTISSRGFQPLLAASAAGVDEIGVVAVDEGRRSTGPIIVIDNYDSFTYNLCQNDIKGVRRRTFLTRNTSYFDVKSNVSRGYLGKLGADFEVYRNDELTVDEIKRKNPKGILISPGPGTPQDSGISLQIVLDLGPSTPIFGVCMGLQCIGEAFGGKIVRSPYGVMHGKGSLVYYDEKGEDGLLAGLSNPFTAGRYHSLVIENESFPRDMLEITARTEDGLVMAVRHKKYKHIQGVQFHPESIITSEGITIVHNFLKLIEKREKETE